MIVWNPLKRPINKTSLENWAKMFEDFVKICLIAIPANIYSQFDIQAKVINLILLTFGVYCFSVICTTIRHNLVSKE